MTFPGNLHSHTDYSNGALGFRDSINTYQGLIDYAIELGHNAIAITEHEFVGNHIKIEKYAEKVKDKIKVIRGNEIYLCRNDLTSETAQQGEKYYHFLLLAKDEIGHKQMRELSTRAWGRSFVGRGLRRKPTYYSDLEEIIGADRGHITGLTSCIGSAIGQQLLQYKETNDTNLYQQIINWCHYLQGIFGENDFYLEMQPSATREQEYVNKELYKISTSLNIPYVITTDAHYCTKEDAGIHAAFLNSQSDAEREVKEFYATTYMMGTEELESYMNNYLSPQDFQMAYQNIQKIIDSCKDYTLQKPLKIPCLSWKESSVNNIPQDWIDKFPNIQKFIDSDFEGDKLLARLIVERVQNDETLQTQETYNEINLELDYTWVSSEANKAHWSAYFLNLQNIIDECWNAGSLVGASRGSGTGFLLLYILGITQINPLREKTRTFPWRFLNPARVSPLEQNRALELNPLRGVI